MNTKKTKNELTIYTNENCRFCTELKEILDKEKIKYNEVIASENLKEWRDVVNLTNIPTTPTLHYKNPYFVPGRDYQNPQSIPNLINEYEKPKFSNEILIYEKVKTLNYHINLAFSRLEQVLNKIESKLNTNENKK